MISLYLSGGANNTTPSASLGGPRSTSSVPRRLFSPVSEDQFNTGVVLYRCVYVATDHTCGLIPWISVETPSAETTVALGWGTSPLGPEQAILTGTDAPVGVSFISPYTPAEGVNGGSLSPGEYRPLWLRYTVTHTNAAPFVEAFLIVIDETAPP